MRVTASRTPSRTSSPKGGGRLRLWTREEYRRAGKLGLFGPEERLELLDGEIIQKMPHGSLHAFVVKRADRLLADAFGSDCHTRPQLPLVLNDLSEPEPDVVVVVGTEYDYLSDHPQAMDSRLVVEVADSTLRFDRSRKRSAYARSGILEYWIINLLERQIEVHRDPRGSRYRSVTIYREGETVTALAAPHASIAVSDLLPPPVAPNE
jgi:Uma2 family endonuclease